MSFRFVGVCVMMLLPAVGLDAQPITGSVEGTVADPGGSAIAGAAVRLVSDTTGVERTLHSDPNGNFVINAVPPGGYTLAVEHPGFKKYERSNIQVTATEHVSLGQIRMALGDVTQSVTVREEGAAVQTASSERSGIISSVEVENLTVINRDFSVLVSLMPGVVMENTGEVQGAGANPTFYALGTRNTQNNITLDGMLTETTNSTWTSTFVSMDSVQTVRVLVSNFQAEFGRKPGAGVQAITKSGTKQFHGTAYWYKRHEGYNARNFFDNRSAVPVIPYRYTNAGFNIGGPVYIPKLFNKGRSKLFFFFSEEQIREARPQAIRQLTTPTAAERLGDFSNSRDLNGALVPIYDPENGRRAFPGNIIPASRIDRNGQAYLNLLPLPNFDNIAISARRYNYQVQESLWIPKHTEVARVDYMIGPKTTFYGRYNNWWEDQKGFAVSAGNSNWGWMPNHYIYHSQSFMLSVSRIVTPSMVLEASGSVQRLYEAGPPLSDELVQRITRKTAGWTVPQFNPGSNPLGLLPQATFTGRTGAISTAYNNRFPLRGGELTYNWSGTLTKTSGPHVSKAGIFAENWFEVKGENGNFAGNFSFNRDTNNSQDSNDGFSNALLGNFTSYTESTTRPPLYGRLNLVEWYVQDNWKATRRLTLDFGLRFGWSQPWHSHRNDEAGFLPSLWKPADTAVLLAPVMSGGRRLAIDPLSKVLYPALAIGAISPLSKNPFSASVDRSKDPSYPAGLRKASGIKYGPRFGFAWDPWGKGRTAIRGGAGVFYQMKEPDNFGKNTYLNPPMQLNPTVYYGTLATLTSMTNLLFPSATTGFNPDRTVARTMNYSFGIQHNVGAGTVVDVSYVGSQGRHLMQRRNLNTVPFGANFLPANFDPTQAGRALTVNFLRPYLGYADVNFYSYDSTSNYNSLQVSANRRFSRHFSYGAAWTWSKAMDFVDSDDANVSMLVNPRVWNYGKAGYDRTHVVKLYWTADVPKASRIWRNGFTRAALDGWQLSGIATFMSGAPFTPGVALSYSSDITGSPTDTAARTVVLRDPRVERGERTFGHFFDGTALSPPAIGTPGNAPKDLLRGPGTNNFDMSLFKWIRTGSERVKLQLRCETYNTFNHTQFSGLDSAARFDQTGRQINAALSSFTSARSPRRIQLALRLSF
jgi:hypothetical protein